MTPRSLRPALLAVVCAAQLAWPAFLLSRHERTLAEGAAFRFTCPTTGAAASVRGWYLVLRCPPLCAPTPRGERFVPGERVFVRIERDADGFAEPTGVSRERPERGSYLLARVAGWSEAHGVAIDLPFHRYYLGEELAAVAERAFPVGGHKKELQASIDARVRNGRAVLEELYLGGLPAREYLEKEAARSE